METKEPLGEWVGYHTLLIFERPDPCWQPCSYCLAGAYRYRDEAVAQKVLDLLRRWAS